MYENTNEGFTSKDDLLRFLFAGRARFTITSKKSGQHKTYRLVKSLRQPQGAIKFSLYTAAGSAFLGTLRVSGDAYIFSRHFKSMKDYHDAILLADWLFLMLHKNPDRLFEQCTIQHTNTCGKCSRELTDPQSIALGLGPICRGDQ